MFTDRYPRERPCAALCDSAYAPLGTNALLVPGLVYVGLVIAFIVRRPTKLIN